MNGGLDRQASVAINKRAPRGAAARRLVATEFHVRSHARQFGRRPSKILFPIKERAGCFEKGLAHHAVPVSDQYHFNYVRMVKQMLHRTCKSEREKINGTGAGVWRGGGVEGRTKTSDDSLHQRVALWQYVDFSHIPACAVLYGTATIPPSIFLYFRFLSPIFWICFLPFVCGVCCAVGRCASTWTNHSTTHKQAGGEGAL